MNTINNPLIVRKGIIKPYLATNSEANPGEYVSKELAIEILEALETLIEMLDSSEEDEITEKVKLLILKAKG